MRELESPVPSAKYIEDSLTLALTEAVEPYVQEAAQFAILALSFVHGWVAEELGTDAADQLMRDLRDGLLNGPRE